MSKKKRIEELEKRIDELEREVERLRFTPIVIPINDREITLLPEGPRTPLPPIQPWTPYEPSRTVPDIWPTIWRSATDTDTNHENYVIWQ